LSTSALLQGEPLVIRGESSVMTAWATMRATRRHVQLRSHVVHTRNIPLFVYTSLSNHGFRAILRFRRRSCRYNTSAYSCYGRWQCIIHLVARWLATFCKKNINRECGTCRPRDPMLELHDQRPSSSSSSSRGVPPGVTAFKMESPMTPQMESPLMAQS
jgi:hypothetical protein